MRGRPGGQVVLASALVIATMGTAGSATAQPISRLRPVTTCQQAARTRHMIKVDSVANLHRIQISGRRVHMHCGGEDDFQFDVTKRFDQVTLARGAVVKVLKAVPKGILDRRIKPRRLKAWLRDHDIGGAIFWARGGPDHVRRFIELYHP